MFEVNALWVADYSSSWVYKGEGRRVVRLIQEEEAQANLQF